MAVALTNLKLDPIGVPPYSARGIQQTLQPIDASSQMFRTINGTLIDIAPVEMQKFKSSIVCRDFQHPALDGVFPGQQLIVDCVVDLCYADTTDGTPSRTVVPGSSEIRDGFVMYRPQLTMLVTGWNVGFSEWAGECNWALELAEV